MSDEVERRVGNHQKKQRRFGHGHQRTPVVGKQGIHHPVDHVGRFGENHQLGRHGGDLGQWQKREQAQARHGEHHQAWQPRHPFHLGAKDRQGSCRGRRIHHQGQ